MEKIPKGKVATYGQIASLCGLPGQARFVGYALHNTPFGLEIPWHRVINAQGKISFPKESLHHKRQKKLLLAEGVHFDNDKIDFKVFGWKRII